MMASSGNRPRILIADAEAAFRAGLRDVFEHNEIEVVAEASTGEEAVKEALRTLPNVVVMDLLMLRMAAPQAAREITNRVAGTRIVMVADSTIKDEHLLRAIEAGVRSYITKDEPPQTFVDAVRIVQQDGSFLSPLAAQLVARHFSGSPRPQLTAAEPIVANERLTDRELEVLCLIANGYGRRQIAHELHISVRSVGNHLAKIYAKLHIHSRAQATVYAVKAGIRSVD